MVKIICDTNEEKKALGKVLRLGEFAAMGLSIIYEIDFDCFNYREIRWKVKEKGGMTYQ